MTKPHNNYMDDAITIFIAKFAVAKLSIVLPTASADPSTAAEEPPDTPIRISCLGFIEITAERS